MGILQASSEEAWTKYIEHKCTEKNIYQNLVVHGIFGANKSLDHKITPQTQAEAVGFLLRDLNWKIPYVPQWVHTLTDSNLPSSALRSQIWSISAPDFSKNVRGWINWTRNSSLMYAPVRRASDNVIMTCDGCRAGFQVGDTDNPPTGAPQVSADTRPLLFALRWGEVRWSLMVTFQYAACGVTELPQ